MNKEKDNCLGNIAQLNPRVTIPSKLKYFSSLECALWQTYCYACRLNLNFNFMKTIHFVLPIALAVLSCSSETTERENFIDYHNVQNSLDWDGVYSGVIPCADCEGIEIELTLTQDMEYKILTRYIGQPNESISEKGIFQWKGNNIELQGKTKQSESETTIIKVEENQLRILDLNGNIIEGNLSEQYVLRKEGNVAVENKRWRLVELGGLPINGSAETHYIIFHSQDNKLEAKANCNMMHFEYKIRNEFQLTTKAGLSTLMACQDDTEDQLKNVIQEADNISVNENRLSLNKARMVPLAVFVLAD